MWYVRFYLKDGSDNLRRFSEITQIKNIEVIRNNNTMSEYMLHNSNPFHARDKKLNINCIVSNNKPVF